MCACICVCVCVSACVCVYAGVCMHAYFWALHPLLTFSKDTAALNFLSNFVCAPNHHQYSYRFSHASADGYLFSPG